MVIIEKSIYKFSVRLTASDMTVLRGLAEKNKVSLSQALKMLIRNQIK